MILEATLTVIAVLVATLVATIYVSRRRFQSQVASEMEWFLPQGPHATSTVDVAVATRDLPPPVQRYLLYTLGGSTHTYRSALVSQEGSFRLKPQQRWMKMKAEEWFRLDQPGYHWHASIAIAPLLWFDVRDFYFDGKAAILGKLESTFPVVSADSKEVVKGALIRWAAEAAWVPHAFLNRDVFRWEPIDEQSARLIVQHRGNSAALTCRFDETDRLVSMETLDRPFEKEGTYVQRPYVVTFKTWAAVGPYMLPLEGEARWILPEGPFNYVRVEVQSIEFKE